MGQATLDLPDPLEQPPESAAGTDDLLAQLAGDEIDRLLAESDQPPAASAPTDVSGAPPEPLLLETPPVPVERPPEAQLGDFLGQIAAERPNDATGPQIKPRPTQGTEAASPREAALNKLVAEADSFEEDASLAAAERGALKTAETTAFDDAIAEDPAGRNDRVASRPPVLLRVLAWINAPLDSLSDDARDLVGKIAILTMVNALSVLVYVLFFRRHG
jgi:hypothetical protein